MAQRSQKSFKEIISSYECGISYRPTKIEISPTSLFPEISEKIVHTIQPIATLDIATEVKITKEACADKSTFICIPGRAFDATGTRYGKGAGWYDRFLSAVPREWLRVGFCYDDQFSATPLVRESWDEPMDFICVVEKDTNKILCYDTRMQEISLIAAIGAGNRALGKDNKLLWHIPEDLKRFKKLTDVHSVIMGRKTWESLPEKFRPLPGRLNIVVTRQANYEAQGATVCASLEAAIHEAKNEIFIIGGGELYKEALPFADKLYLTLIDDTKDGDVFFPEYEQLFTKKVFEEKHASNGLAYTWVDLERA